MMSLALEQLRAKGSTMFLLYKTVISSIMSLKMSMFYYKNIKTTQQVTQPDSWRSHMLVPGSSFCSQTDMKDLRFIFMIFPKG